jgi:hypothetical protein
MGYFTDKDGDRRWDGKGSPDSRGDAIEYLLKAGFTQREAELALPKNGGKSVLGTRARKAIEVKASEEEDRLKEEGIDPKTGDPIEATPDADANLVTPDIDNDGTITPEEAEASVMAADAGVPLDEFLAGGPGALAAANPRGAALWPYEGDPEQLAELRVDNNTRVENLSRGPNLGPPEKPMSDTQRMYLERTQGMMDQQGPRTTKARYYERDGLLPLRWSEEQRADLQRLMQNLGLYGESKTRLGTWGAGDQSVFSEVLAQANVAGVTWLELLSGWNRNGLPEDLKAKLDADKPKRPTIQLTNPLDIQQGARDVSQSLIGEVDRNFVDGYSFLGAFEQFMSMLGVQ